MKTINLIFFRIKFLRIIFLIKKYLFDLNIYLEFRKNIFVVDKLIIIFIFYQ